MKKINFSHVTPNTEILGPYHRGVLWVQGCCFSCPGCVAEHLQGEGGSWCSTGKMAEYFLSQPQIEGITISGGEPFLQADALAEMGKLIRQKKDLGIIVYSGMYLAEIKRLAERKNSVKEFLSQIDLLIDGRYEKELDDGRRAVGSSNQTVHHLTARYEKEASDYYKKEGRQTEIILAGKKMQLIGVPDKKGNEIWKKLQE